jgi:hypothetical protein
MAEIKSGYRLTSKVYELNNSMIVLIFWGFEYNQLIDCDGMVFFKINSTECPIFGGSFSNDAMDTLANESALFWMMASLKKQEIFCASSLANHSAR